MLKQLLVSVAVIVAISPPPARASEWGCQVLLCAASDNPNWQGVPSCRPPMARLISAMKRPGFSWPTCPEGGAGKPGYEQYEECPTGWVPSPEPQGGDQASSGELSRCSRTMSQCGWGSGSSDNQAAGDGAISRVYSDESAGKCIEFMARPLRARPYFFDIIGQDGGETSRHYFNLNK